MVDWSYNILLKYKQWDKNVSSKMALKNKNNVFQRFKEVFRKYVDDLILENNFRLKSFDKIW